MRRALALLIACMLCGCHAPRADSGTKPPAKPTAFVRDVSEGGARRIEEVRIGYKTICRVDGRDFPPSYLVSDLGKPGVPKLEPAFLRQVRDISRYVHSKTLRFQEVEAQFLVYDASLGPCLLAAPGYWVLNAPGCNLYFMPADEWNGPSAVPGCYTPRRPWIAHDGGNPNLPWGSVPAAGISTPHP